MTVKALVFDMDGLMFDSEAVYCVAFVRAAKEIGMRFTEQDYLSLVGKSEEDTQKHLGVMYAQSHSRPTSDYPHDEFVDVWLTHWRALTKDQQVPLKPGVIELLDWAGEHALPCAIATGSGREQLDLYLAQRNLAERFRFTVTREDVKQGKPAAAPYLAAAKGLDVDPGHCVAFEDSNTGCASAVAAGIRVIVVPDLLEANAVTQRTAAAVVSSLHDARERVMAWHQ